MSMKTCEWHPMTVSAVLEMVSSFWTPASYVDENVCMAAYDYFCCIRDDELILNPC